MIAHSDDSDLLNVPVYKVNDVQGLPRVFLQKQIHTDVENMLDSMRAHHKKRDDICAALKRRGYI